MTTATHPTNPDATSAHLGPHAAHDSTEARREAFTMALYLCLVLGAEFVVAEDYINSTRRALGVIWGTAIGLAFAFGLASRLFAGGEFESHARTSILYQLVAALSLAVMLSVPFLVADAGLAFDIDTVLIAAFIAITVYVIALASGSTRLRAIIDGIIMLALALAVIAIKAALKS